MCICNFGIHQPFSIMYSYDTVLAALSDLKKRGFSIDFNIAFDKLICSQNQFCLNPSEFEITEVYRFEGDSNPSDEETVYALQSLNGELKGVLHTGYGIYNDEIAPELLKKISTHYQ